VKIRGGVVVAVLALAAVGFVTHVARDYREVVVLRTQDERGVSYDSRMWLVDLDAAMWVRASNPRRSWYQHLLVNPRAELVRGGRTQAVTAVPDESATAREMVDEAFRAKYGWIDRCYGLILQGDAVPVRLLPIAP
jgi:hypothetical protein